MVRFAGAVCALLALATATATPSVAHHDDEIVEANGMRLSHAYTAPAAAMAHGVHVYLLIENRSDTDDRLVSARVPFAEPARFEANVLADDGSLAVRTVPSVSVSAGQTLTLQPGSLRLVFDNVTQPLAEGTLFPLTLTFEEAGEIEVIGEVSAEPEPEHHDDHADAQEPAS